MNRIGLSLPLPCLAVLTLTCLNTTHLHAEETLLSTSSTIIQVDESMIPALLMPMSHLVATQNIESAAVQDNSLAMSRTAVIVESITHHRIVPTNQLNIDDHAPAQKIKMPKAKDFTPTTTPSAISHQTPVIYHLSFAMLGR
jgi:hypothetical protein